MSIERILQAAARAGSAEQTSATIDGKKIGGGRVPVLEVLMYRKNNIDTSWAPPDPSAPATPTAAPTA